MPRPLTTALAAFFTPQPFGVAAPLEAGAVVAGDGGLTLRDPRIGMPQAQQQPVPVVSKTPASTPPVFQAFAVAAAEGVAVAVAIAVVGEGGADEGRGGCWRTIEDPVRRTAVAVGY